MSESEYPGDYHVRPRPQPSSGWSTDYYELPPGAEQLQDLIEYKNMNFAVANIFKAAYRLGEKPGTTELYDINKILWFALRGIYSGTSLSRFGACL